MFDQRAWEIGHLNYLTALTTPADTEGILSFRYYNIGAKIFDLSISDQAKAKGFPMATSRCPFDQAFQMPERKIFVFQYFILLKNINTLIFIKRELFAQRDVLACTFQCA